MCGRHFRRPLARFRREERAIDSEGTNGGEIVVDDEIEEPKAPNAWQRLWRTEPALIRGFIAASMILLISFNVAISVSQQAAILGFVAALLMLGQAFSTRQSVYPQATVDKIEADYEGTIEAAYEIGVEDGSAEVINARSIG